MIKRTIKFEDLDGNVVEEEFYFNLSIPELAEMELGHEDGSLGEEIMAMIQSGKGAEVMAFFKMLLEKSVGKRSEDGRRFLKTQDIVDNFMMSDAYSALFMDLCTDANFAAEFMNGIMPAEDKLKKFLVVTSDGEKTPPEEPLYKRENRKPNKQELMAMEKGELLEAMQWEPTAEPQA